MGKRVEGEERGGLRDEKGRLMSFVVYVRGRKRNKKINRE